MDKAVMARLMPVDTDDAFLDDLKKWIDNRADPGVYCRLTITVRAGKAVYSLVERERDFKR
jgi:hypothetical protein